MNDTKITDIEQKIRLKIKFERIKRGFSQEEFAEKANLSRNTIWKIETGRISPTVISLLKIANALEMEFSELMDITNIKL